MRLLDLKPGDVVDAQGLNKRFAFIGIMHRHPLWPQFAMVVWREVHQPAAPGQSDHPMGWVAGEWFHDALVPQMDMPHASYVEGADKHREATLRLCLVGGD